MNQPRTTEQITHAIADSLAPTTSEKPIEFSPPERPKPRQKPLRNEWQRKWLDLEVTHPDVQTLADAAEAFATHWYRAKGRGQLRCIVGKPGCGKTHVTMKLWAWSRAVAMQRWQTCPSSTLNIPGIVIAKWATIGTPEQTDNDAFAAWIGDVGGSNLVFIDDIGTETDKFRTGIPAQRLCQVLDRCENKWLWLTTNKLPRDWADTWDRRVEDRLLGGEVLDLEAPSWRSER